MCRVCVCPLFRGNNLKMPERSLLQHFITKLNLNIKIWCKTIESSPTTQFEQTTWPKDYCWCGCSTTRFEIQKQAFVNGSISMGSSMVNWSSLHRSKSILKCKQQLVPNSCKEKCSLVVDGAIDTFSLELLDQFLVVQVVAPAEENQLFALHKANQISILDDVLGVHGNAEEAHTLGEIGGHLDRVIQRILVLCPLGGKSLGEKQDWIALLFGFDPTQISIRLVINIHKHRNTYSEQISGWNEEMRMFRSPP